jgi:hypothetical protein
MSPHKLFLILLAYSVPLSALAFIKDTNELTSLLLIMGAIGAAITAVLVLTRKYWKNARRLVK